MLYRPIGMLMYAANGNTSNAMLAYLKVVDVSCHVLVHGGC